MYADKNVLKKIHNCLKKKDIDILYGNLIYVSPSPKCKVVRHWKSRKFNINNLKYGWMPAHPTFFLKKHLYKKFGGFDESYSISSDYDSMLRFLKTKHLNIYYLDELLVKMTIGGNSNKITNILPKMKEDYKILKTWI